MQGLYRPQREHFAVRFDCMNRIAIIGCGGSGKTYVARKLVGRLNLPLTHLDSVYYDADRNPLPHEHFADRQRDFVTRPRWLIEGNYASTLSIRLGFADTVIFSTSPLSLASLVFCNGAGITVAVSMPATGSTTGSAGISCATSGVTARPCDRKCVICSPRTVATSN
jgi:hypothetical protein